MSQITFITGNKYKADSMTKALKPFGIDVRIENIDPPEIQALTSGEVASFSARWTADKLNKPVIKADTGLFIEALGGLPGVYTSAFQKQLGPEKLLRMMNGEQNRNAKIVYSVAYCEPGKDTEIFESGCSGTISKAPRGKEGMLIDFIFVPEGSDKTMGELKERDPNRRTQAWGNAEAQFTKWFLKHQTN